MRTLRISILMLAAAFLSLAFTWPFEQKSGGNTQEAQQEPGTEQSSGSNTLEPSAVSQAGAEVASDSQQRMTSQNVPATSEESEDEDEEGLEPEELAIQARDSGKTPDTASLGKVSPQTVFEAGQASVGVAPDASVGENVPPRLPQGPEIPANAGDLGASVTVPTGTGAVQNNLPEFQNVVAGVPVVPGTPNLETTGIGQGNVPASVGGAVGGAPAISGAPSVETNFAGQPNVELPAGAGNLQPSTGVDTQVAPNTTFQPGANAGPATSAQASLPSGVPSANVQATLPSSGVTQPEVPAVIPDATRQVLQTAQDAAQNNAAFGVVGTGGIGNLPAGTAPGQVIPANIQPNTSTLPDLPKPPSVQPFSQGQIPSAPSIPSANPGIGSPMEAPREALEAKNNAIEVKMSGATVTEESRRVGASVAGNRRALDPQIKRIQKQIQQLVSINETLKYRYSEQSSEIQKIGEQAKIHQRILSDLEAQVAEGDNPSALAQKMEEEKVRLIQEETNKQEQFIQNLQQDNAAQ